MSQHVSVKATLVGELAKADVTRERFFGQMAFHVVIVAVFTRELFRTNFAFHGGFLRMDFSMPRLCRLITELLTTLFTLDR